MAKKTYLRVALDITMAAKLAEKARAAGVSADAYASTVIASEVLGFRKESKEDETGKPVGRPVSPENDDLSSRIERNAAITSGFVGVYARGHRWVARWLYDELGRFSTPELAAIVRYWFEQGRRSVARDSLVATGTPRAEAIRLTRCFGDGEPLAIAVAQSPVTEMPKRRGRPRAQGVAISPETVAALPDATLRGLRAADLGELPGTPGATAQDVFNHTQSLAEHTAVAEAVRATSTDEDANGGGPSDTTYDEPPEDLGSRPGGEVPASPRSLRWPQKFRQPRMVAYDPPPPKPPEPGSDPDPT